MSWILIAILPLLLAACVCDNCLSPVADDKPEWADDFDQYLYKSVGDADLMLYHKKPADEFSGERPAVVFFFGGGFINGSPGQFAPQCRELAALGIHGITVNYRVKSRNNSTPLDSMADGRAAVAWVRSHAAALGIDPNRIASGGGSAGGGVASMTGLVAPEFEAGELNADSRANAMILFNPVVVAAEVEGKELRPQSRVDGYLERWGRKSIEEMSAYHNIGDYLPPTLIMHGDADTVCPLSTITCFAEKYQSKGGRCELVIYPGQGHGFFNPGKAAPDHYPPTRDEMIKFLRSLSWIF